MINLVLLGFLGSLAAGFMTTLGALPVLIGKAPSERTRDTLLGFAAGAMLYVISHKIIPETHRNGFQNQATSGLAVGLCLMLFLDVWLG